MKSETLQALEAQLEVRRAHLQEAEAALRQFWSELNEEAVAWARWRYEKVRLAIEAEEALARDPLDHDESEWAAVFVWAGILLTFLLVGALVSGWFVVHR